MLASMAKRKTTPPVEPPEPPKPTRYPSREKVKYVAVPVEFWDILEAMGKPDDRSVSYMVRKALREFLERNNKLPTRRGGDST